MTTANPPLGPEHLAQIDAALAQIAEGEQRAQLAQMAGIDVSAQVTQLQAAKSRLQAIKQVYFPGR